MHSRLKNINKIKNETTETESFQRLKETSKNPVRDAEIILGLFFPTIITLLTIQGRRGVSENPEGRKRKRKQTKCCRGKKTELFLLIQFLY